jgi:superfamily II DNA helicase RecQ
VVSVHLISQWGHDFRPDYMLLGAQAEAVGASARLALTATAAPPVRQEVVQRLGLRDPVVVIGDFDRPHIHLSVHRALTVSDKRQELIRAAGQLAGPGIVYAATHASAQAAHDALAAAGEQVTHTAALVRLTDLGAVTWQADGEVRWAGTMSVAAALAASEALTEREDEVERTRLTMMRHYAEHAGCRRSFLLTYFGQDYPGPCGNCDNDLTDAAVPAAGIARAEVPFAVGARAVSERWGEGTVQRYDGDQVTVLFDEHGYRELFLPVVLRRGLLRPA